MKKANELIAELRTLIGKTDERSNTRRDEIARWFRENGTEEDRALFQDFLEEGVSAVRSEIESIRQQISDDDYRLLPLSYIASHYFNKSTAWLSQRINGTPVRGRVYTLSEEQKSVFNKALKDIGRRIGSFQIA